MALLSTLTGGGGVKSVTRYTFEAAALTNSTTDWSQTVTITAVADMAKTSVNLTMGGTAHEGGTANYGTIGVRLESTTSVAYVLGAVGGVETLAFEVIEYN